MPKPRHFALLLVACAACFISAMAQTGARKVAVLDFGETPTGMRAAESLAQALASFKTLSLADREESRAAARGLGYTGSLNMTLGEARDLGGAIGTDFYVTGDAQTLRRSPSTGAVYYEAYASIFIVSTRSGRLILWERPSFEAATSDEAEAVLLRELKKRGAHYAESIAQGWERERSEHLERLERITVAPPVIEDAPEDEATAARENLRLPQPYRRLRPSYPETAARAAAEATVDVQLEIDERGEVSRVEVVRWAGFGLDEAAISTVRQLHFAPARRNGQPVPLRVLLRYNFRRPPK